MNTSDFEKFLRRLSEVSTKTARSPFDIDWPAATNLDGWYFSPELISIFATPLWESMDESQQKRLSLYEAANFFSLNIHGEKYLISEISRRLYDAGDSALSQYLAHFIEEEMHHMMYFSGFCQRYVGAIYADKTVHGDGSGSSETDMFLLFARIQIFEQIVDHYNKTMAKDDRLEPIAREINRMHHAEETRHLAFGKAFLQELLATQQWDDEIRADFRTQLDGYLQFVWKQYYNPDVYRDSGIAQPFDVWKSISRADETLTRQGAVNRPRLSFLYDLDLLEAP